MIRNEFKNVSAAAVNRTAQDMLELSRLLYLQNLFLEIANVLNAYNPDKSFEVTVTKTADRFGLPQDIKNVLQIKIPGKHRFSQPTLLGNFIFRENKIYDCTDGNWNLITHLGSAHDLGETQLTSLYQRVCEPLLRTISLKDFPLISAAKKILKHSAA